MTDGANIGPEEKLGRDIFSSNQAKRARRGRIPINVFLEREGESLLSVDCLDRALPGEASRIADRVAAGRRRTFYGWAVVDARTAASSGRQVRASAQLDNPYHADIVLPDVAIEDREEQKRHAQELADASIWRARDADTDN